MRAAPLRVNQGSVLSTHYLLDHISRSTAYTAYIAPGPAATHKQDYDQ